MVAARFAQGVISHLRGRINRIPAHRRYSRFVVLMKVLLPASAAILLALVVSWPRLVQEQDRFRVGFAKLSASDVETLSMVNARFHGVDAQNRPFLVTADLALERNPGQGLIDLQAPRADFSSRSGDGIYMEATKGIFHQKEQVLELLGTVSLFHDKGYEVHTSHAVIDLARNTAKGEEPVNGHGPQGQIQASGFEIRDSGREVVFTGRSQVSLTGARAK